jgi:hypothetical protein
MAEEDEEPIATPYSGPDKEEPKWEEEKPDERRDQDEAGADVDKLTNIIWSFRSTIEKLDHLINALKSSISEEEKADVEEQIVDARERMVNEKKRLDDYRLNLGNSAPPIGELEASLNKQYEIAMADTEEIAKRRKK